MPINKQLSERFCRSAYLGAVEYSKWLWSQYPTEIDHLKNNGMAFVGAVKYGELDFLKFLYGLPGSDTLEDTHYQCCVAAENNHPHIIEYLSTQIGINAWTPGHALSHAARFNANQAIEYLVYCDDVGCWSFMDASKWCIVNSNFEGLKHIVIAVISTARDVDDIMQIAISIACQEGQTEMIQYLLSFEFYFAPYGNTTHCLVISELYARRLDVKIPRVTVPADALKQHTSLSKDIINIVLSFVFNSHCPKFQPAVERAIRKIL
jgi:hypothetical protein